MAETLTEAMQEAATQLRESASSHKRAANQHRKQARSAMEALERLQEVCRENGIRLVLVPRGRAKS